MNTPKNILPLSQLIYRQALRKASSEAYPVPARYNQFKNRRTQFETPDTTPVHVKGGFGDKMITKVTWVLCLVGTGFGLNTFYTVVFGKK